MRQQTKSWLVLSGFLLVVLAFVLTLNSKDDGWAEEAVLRAELSVSPLLEDTGLAVQPMEQKLSRTEYARSLSTRFEQKAYVSENTLIAAYVSAVQESPEVFDEAREVFASLMTPSARDMVYIAVMDAYVQLIPIHHAALDQYLDAFDLWLSKDRIDTRSEQLDDGDIQAAFHTFQQAWKTSDGDERLLQKIWDFEHYFEYQIKQEMGFDSTVRYTDKALDQILHAGGQDPFRCTLLAERINQLLWLSKLRNDKVKTRLWMTHLADYYVTAHFCENGHPHPEPERAYELYVELGLLEDAKNAARLVVNNDANNFIFGGDIYVLWRKEPKPLDQNVLAHTKLWLTRTGLSASEQGDALRELAIMSEEAWYLDAALALYADLGDPTQVERLRPLAVENPRPPEDIQLEYFFLHLGASESRY